MTDPRRTRLALAALVALAGLTSPGLSGCGASPSASGPGGPTGPTGPTGPAEPITAPAETWTWVPFPDAQCADGSATGIGVNLTSRSSDLVVYFEGGGACWDDQTCFTYDLAVHVTGGYGPAEFAAEAPGAAAPFDRGATANPLKDASFVFVPYCTGDLNAGAATRTYGTHLVHHAGAANVAAYLRRLAVTFPGARRVYVTGSSAGGFAAQINYPRFAAAFPSAELHALADSAQAVQPLLGLYPIWLAAWNPVIPAGCSGCAGDLTALPAWLADTYPDGRFALLAYEQDGTLAAYFGLYTAADYKAATLGLFASAYDGRANAHYFALDGTSHTMLGSLPTLATSPGGTTLQAWVGQWYAGDAGWASLKP